MYLSSLLVGNIAELFAAFESVVAMGQLVFFSFHGRRLLACFEPSLPTDGEV
ncbi:MAG: hypothetical protein ACYS6W_16965 [Planctomycetota bacterium]|jgi:hypothetical protein